MVSDRKAYIEHVAIRVRSLLQFAMIKNLEELPDVKLLRLFDLLYTIGNLTRAAEQLNQSQPTVSIWLAHLRRKFGDPLFIRAPGGMLPTPRADELIGPARDALAAMRRMTGPMRQFDPAVETRASWAWSPYSMRQIWLPPCRAIPARRWPGLPACASSSLCSRYRVSRSSSTGMSAIITIRRIAGCAVFAPGCSCRRRGRAGRSCGMAAPGCARHPRLRMRAWPKEPFANV